MSVKIDSTTDTAEDVLNATGNPAESAYTSETLKEEVETKEDSETFKELSKEEQPEAESSEDEKEDSEDHEGEDEGESDESEDEDNEDSAEQAKPKRENGFKKRIKRFQKRISEKEQEIEYWKRQALGKTDSSSEQAEDTNEQSVAKEANGRPAVDSFDTYEEYIDALTDWKVDQKHKETTEKQKLDRAKQTYAEQLNTFQERVADYAAENDEFEDAIYNVDDVTMSPGLQESLLVSDFAPEVMFEIAKDRESYIALNKKNPIAIAREIGKIEARIALSKESDKTEESSSKKVRKAAPKPISPIGASKTQVSNKKPEDMSYQEYKKWREQKRSRA